MNRKYFVLLGDVVASRKIAAADAFQKKLESALDSLNAVYSRSIFAPFKILKGRDELGIVLTSIVDLYPLLIDFYSCIQPVHVRFALVHGEIDTSLRSRDTAKMDGPAFHRAALMIQELKKTKTLFGMATVDEYLDPLFTAQINALLMLHRNWTSKQWRVVREYERQKNQTAAAKKLKITQQAVSKILLAAQWEQIRIIEGALNQALQHFSQQIK